ncbi:hypothetical protein FRX31_008007 [Thalictrum thalictroides]|uniref:Uncharacterized protein n=1 Tax=Thalictrum thalictroides TaxID=46969 RepID=A0A7J6WY82_THATH|nr:hypothetical protein FRX31_008007 [Thalictrum thalictroides]
MDILSGEAPHLHTQVGSSGPPISLKQQKQRPKFATRGGKAGHTCPPSHGGDHLEIGEQGQSTSLYCFCTNVVSHSGVITITIHCCCRLAGDIVDLCDDGNGVSEFIDEVSSGCRNLSDEEGKSLA